MVIIGAGGLASEILEILLEKYSSSEIFFFDDVNHHNNNLFFGKYPILTSVEEVETHFRINNDFKFCIGVGGVKNRINLVSKFEKIGGKLTSIISSQAYVSTHNVAIEDGVVIMPGVKISNNVKIGKCSLIYYNSVITHDCQINKFCEVSPSVNVLGRVKIFDNVLIGSNSTILPDIVVESEAVIGAGSVVTRNVKRGMIVLGIPAKSK